MLAVSYLIQHFSPNMPHILKFGKRVKVSRTYLMSYNICKRRDNTEAEGAFAASRHDVMFSAMAAMMLASLP